MPSSRLRMSWATMGAGRAGALPSRLQAYPPSRLMKLSSRSRTATRPTVHQLAVHRRLQGQCQELIERVRSNRNPDNGAADREHQERACGPRLPASLPEGQGDSRERTLVQRGRGCEADHGTGTAKCSVTVSQRASGSLRISRATETVRCISVSPCMSTPRSEAVELMPAFFDLLRNEPEASVRVVLGHFFFVNIHPYFDGNGRMGRFLMNAMLASGAIRGRSFRSLQRAPLSAGHS